MTRLTMRHPYGHTLRVLLRSPKYAWTVVLTTALAMALVTTALGTVRAARHPTSSFANPEELFSVRASGEGASGVVPTAAMLRPLSGGLPSVSDHAFAEYDWAVVVADGLTRQRTVAKADLHWFTVAGMRPHAGRGFVAHDTLSASPPRAVISQEFSRELPASTGVGRELMIDGVSHLVVGIAPVGAGRMTGISAWIPVPRSSLIDTEARTALTALVRIRPHLERGALESDLREIASRLTQQWGTGRRPVRYTTVPLEPSPVPLTDLHRALLAAAIATVVVATANIANLTLARAIDRRGRYAIAVALGARPRHVVGEMAVETATLTAAGAALGLVAVIWSTDFLRRLVPAHVPWAGSLDLKVDWTAGAFAIALGLVVGLGACWGPALTTARALPAQYLRAGAMTARSRRSLYSWIVVLQLALALAVMTSAGMLTLASRRVAALDYGHDRRGLVTTTIALTRPAGTSDRTTLAGVVNRATEALGSTTWWAPPAERSLEVVGFSPDGGVRSHFGVALRTVGPNYLEVLGIPLLRGRPVLPGDWEGPPVAVVDENAAHLLWPETNPIGQQLSVAGKGVERQLVKVVGVAKAVRTTVASVEAQTPGVPTVYLSTEAAPRLRFVVTRAHPGSEARALATVARRLQADAPSDARISVESFSAESDRLEAAYDFLSTLFWALAAITTLLAVAGLHAVLAYSGTTRRREFAVRLALGGSPRAIGGLVIREGAHLALAGTALGAFLAFVAARLIDPFLFDMYRIDVRALLAAELGLGLLSAVAIASPARAATRTSPFDVARGE